MSERKCALNADQKKAWKEFQNNGLLWFVNNLLHLFGYAIKFYVGDDGDLLNVVPGRFDKRGFSEKSNKSGYRKVTKYFKEHADELLQEAMND